MNDELGCLFVISVKKVVLTTKFSVMSGIMNFIFLNKFYDLQGLINHVKRRKRVLKLFVALKERL